MTARSQISSGALNLRVEESSPGLFCWIVTQLSAQEQTGEVCIDASDHPYPSREAAMSVGTACLKAYKAAAEGLLSMLPSRPTAPF
ncbi:hypothetical protein [Polaromonas sp.]|uniref:hypothetical protein n=1 Tax=Polaromonas sp. TaxID=1869339 RepID=UPI0013B70199|nr:hypothetical protein [Polaromonas sp.]NDP62137.1 hypothetical protein [Polaromonas sp.]